MTPNDSEDKKDIIEATSSEESHSRTPAIGDPPEDCDNSAEEVNNSTEVCNQNTDNIPVISEITPQLTINPHEADDSVQSNTDLQKTEEPETEPTKDVASKSEIAPLKNEEGSIMQNASVKPLMTNKGKSKVTGKMIGGWI